MTEHLPECPIRIGDMSVTVDGVASTVIYYCACASLRRCEERVEEAMDRAWAKATLEIEAHARASALDAAREAVAVLPKGGMGQKAHELWRDALAAIDALRGKP